MIEHVVVADQDFEVAYRPGTLDELVLGEVFTHDHYKLNEIKEVLDGGVVIDVGANIGCVTLACLAYGARLVVAVEPERENLDLFHQNLDGWKTQVETLSIAVGNRWIGDAVETVGTSGGARTVYRPIGEERPTTGYIPVNDFADVLRSATEYMASDERVALLKVDVEGAEYDWFDTATPELLARVNRIHMEFHQTGPEAYGALLAKLAETHSVSAFGPPSTGGMLFAHPYR